MTGDPQRPSSEQLLIALQKARVKLEAAERAEAEPIAIVGMSCRFPGNAVDPDAFWRVLHEGVDAVGPIPPDRWDPDAFYDPNPGVAGKSVMREAALLTAVDEFDCQFFGISPREAANLDPQHRLLLEVGWEALEDAGFAPERLNGSRTGVFVGIGQNDYSRLQSDVSEINAHTGTGNGLCYAPGRLSYVLGLRGPSLAIDTACSSSLVAVHYACRSLRSRECDIALAGGVHLILSPEVGIVLSMTRALSPDGRCKAFSADANGFGRGEGCGVVVLKRISDALADDDRVLAVVRGSAVNHDGAGSGFTVPSVAAQEELIREALRNARLAAGDIDYVEAHGTGTELGDPIEIHALTTAMCEGRPAESPLIVGSVKSNIGHLEAAAGVAGLIKVALALQHDEIPAHLHFSRPSPHIPWDQLSIQVAAERQAWPRSQRPRAAGISSFGMSGTNAHVIVSEAPAEGAAAGAAPDEVGILAIAAKEGSALGTLTAGYAELLRGGATWRDVRYSANTGRSQAGRRVSVVAGTAAEAAAALSARGARGDWGRAGPAPRVVFLFPGQGAQYPGMCRELVASEPVFREALLACDRLVRPWLPMGLEAVLFAGAAALQETSVTQPALFAVGYALSRLWRSWGIEPSAVLGHSIGEYTAACVAGVLSLEDGVRLVATRGALMQGLPRDGAMAAVLAGEDEVAGYVEAHAGAVTLAAINGPSQVVIAGARGAVEAVCAAAGRAGRQTRALEVSHAFHSPLMEPMLAPFAAVTGAVRYGRAQVPVIANVTGRPHDGAPDWARYWVEHVRQPVRFAAGVQWLQAAGYEVYVEVGPQATLSSLGRACVGGRGTWLPSVRPGRERRQLLESLGALYERGAGVAWAAVEGGRGGRRVALPHYPFARERHWVSDGGAGGGRGGDGRGAAAAAAGVEGWLYEIGWERAGAPAAGGGAGGRWLVLADRGGVGAAVAAGLRAAGASVVRVYAGTGPARAVGADWEVAPEAGAAEWALLWAGGPITGVVHLWSLEAPAAGALTPAGLLESEGRGSVSVCGVLQALVAAGGEGRVWVVTREAVPVESGLAGLAQTPVWGLGTVLGLEEPGHWGGLIDLGGEAAVGALVAEVLSDPRGEQVALRGAARYVARVRRGAPAATGGRWTAAGDGAYVITGGTGALGRQTAAWLVAHGARQLLLTSRGGATAASEAAVAGLRAAGATVTVVAADVSDAAAMARALEGAGPIRGVVQAAGGVTLAPGRTLTGAAVRAALAAKVTGSWVLHELAGRGAELWVGYSSIAAVWGSKGQGGYAAANRFGDMLAHYRRGQGAAGLSVNWGPWAGGGLADDAARAQLARLGVGALAPAGALRALDRVVASEAVQVTVAPVEWGPFRAVYEARGQRPLLAALPPPAPAGPSPVAGGAPAVRLVLAAEASGGRAAALTQWLTGEVAAVLGWTTPPAGLQTQGLFELGLDSLLAVELQQRLTAALGVALPPTVAFDHPTVARLSHHLLVTLGWADRDANESVVPRVDLDSDRLAQLQEVSDSDIDAEIEKRLNRLETLVRRI